VDKIVGLEMDADDCSTKPFRIKKLIARLRAVIRRSVKKEVLKENFSGHGLKIDFASSEVSVDGKKISFSPKETKLLLFFARHSGRVYCRNQIIDKVWGDNAFGTPRVVDVHICRLRSQIEKDVLQLVYILTVRGSGYKFADIAKEN